MAGAPVPRLLRKGRRVLAVTLRWPPLMELSIQKSLLPGVKRTLWLFVVFFGSTRAHAAGGEGGRRRRERRGTRVFRSLKKRGPKPLDSLRKVCDTTGAEANNGNDRSDREAAFAEAREVDGQGMREGER
jgi:hypothetical protein